MTTAKRLLTTEEVSELFAVTRQRISQWVLAGRLRRARRNGYDTAEVIRFAEERIRVFEAKGHAMDYLRKRVARLLGG